MKAIYNCVADNPDELTFSEGEVIVVDGEEDQEWWVSTTNIARSVRFLILVIPLKPRSHPSPPPAPLCNYGNQSRSP